MTREDAIEIWLPIISMGVDNMPELKEAFDMAIKALEQEPCEDCVSRRGAIKTISEMDIPEDMCTFEIISHVNLTISNLPPVQPKPKTDVLGKIRAEIDRQEKWLLQAGYNAYNVDIAFGAVKAVVAESGDT